MKTQGEFMKLTKLGTLAILLLLGACAEKPVKLVIDPPVGSDKLAAKSQILYQSQDAASGKTETVAIPVSQLPQRVIIDEPAAKSHEAQLPSATLADKSFSQNSVSLSYLKGVEKVERLYEDRKYQDALIGLAPLLEQYPSQSKLHLMQGTIYRKIGEKRLAYNAYKKALTLDKENLKIQQAVDKLESEIGEVN